CASGEEAYTLAMIFADKLGLGDAPGRLKIYATDVDEDALTVARAAAYSAKAVEAVPEYYRERYFEATNGHFSLRQDLRRLVIFGRHDLLRDAPISRLDLLSCRNTLMYFNAESQDRVLKRFAFGLADEGVLVLGKAESLLSAHHEFTPLDAKLRIFEKTERHDQRERLMATLNGIAQDPPDPEPPADIRIREAILDTDMDAQVVLDTAGAIVLVNTRAREMFHLSPEDTGKMLQEVELSYRPVELRSIVARVRADKQPVSVTDIEWSPAPNDTHWLELGVIPLLRADNDLVGIKITFADVTRYKMLQADLERSHTDLETAYEELQSANEELETTNEELQSTVEELETTNEELQSTNEELETMNEELQSTNEELETVNESLRARTGELHDTNLFFESVLRSLRSGVVVVGRDLEVQVWNARAEDQWGLRADEVQGRSLASLDIGLPTDRLMQPIRDCLAGVSDEINLQLEAVNRRGRATLCAVTCVPRTRDAGEVVGVIVMIDDHEDSQPQSGER
ncbi:MAG TPA: CheR family methyltransferase, partial [Tepidiformaceae bacterium]|nr:CheR family methyltransferase [Tepidiformaceae bacterium]